MLPNEMVSFYLFCPILPQNWSRLLWWERGTLGHSSEWFPVQPNCVWWPLWSAQHVLVLVVRLVVHCYLSIARGRFYCWVDNCVISLAWPSIQFIRWIQDIWDNENISLEICMIFSMTVHIVDVFCRHLRSMFTVFLLSPPRLGAAVLVACR